MNLTSEIFQLIFLFYNYTYINILSVVNLNQDLALLTIRECSPKFEFELLFIFLLLINLYQKEFEHENLIGNIIF
jgi:hypothetical protein